MSRIRLIESSQMVLGLYATVEGIIADAAKGNGSFSCQVRCHD